jgi:hypothetical protein
MEYLKFTLTLLFELIRTNIFKTIYLIIAIISFNLAGTFPDTIDKYKVVHEAKVNNVYIYVCETTTDGKVDYENIWQEGKPLKVKNGVLSLKSYSGANILFWFIFAITSILIIIGTFSSEEEINWEFRDAFEESFSTLIYCELEDDKFYYLALGRLISKRDRQISRRYIARDLGVDGFRDLYRCPKFQTKTQRRETLLNKLGIK